MRSRYIYDKKGDVIFAMEKGEVTVNRMEEETKADYYVMPDIQPYQSMIDGRMITSRSQHRTHLKDHNCVEVGNDSSLTRPPKPIGPPPGLKEEIIRSFHQVMERRR